MQIVLKIISQPYVIPQKKFKQTLFVSIINIKSTYIIKNQYIFSDTHTHTLNLSTKA